jgi:hypothetical protein
MEAVEKALKLQPEDSNILSTQKDIELISDNASCLFN